MNTLGKERLLSLAEFLDELPPAKFDFSVLADEEGLPMLQALAAGPHHCGTVGRGIGWMPARFPDHFQWVKSPWGSNTSRVVVRKETLLDYNYNAYMEVAPFFDIAPRTAEYLFDPYASRLGEHTTPTALADHIRAFVREQTEL